MNRIGQFVARHGRDPGSVLAAPGADFCDDDEIIDVRMKCLAMARSTIRVEEHPGKSSELASPMIITSKCSLCTSVT